MESNIFVFPLYALFGVTDAFRGLERDADLTAAWTDADFRAASLHHIVRK